MYQVLNASQIRIITLECESLSREICAYTTALYDVEQPAIKLNDERSPREPLDNHDADTLVRRLGLHGIDARAYCVTGDETKSWVLIGPQMDPGWEDRAVERARRDGVIG
jgi:hypothetical protein